MNQTILIADDDHGLAELLAMRCEALGFDTIVVDNAQCALFAMISEQPALAILDLNMPAAHDGSVFELLATDPEISEVPVIILTGQKDPATIHRCESLNTIYVPKQRNVWNRLQDTITEIVGELQSPDSFAPRPPRSPRTQRSRGFANA